MSESTTNATLGMKGSTNLQRRWLSMARVVVLVLILFLLGTFILSVALFPAYVASNHSDLAPNINWTTETASAALAQLDWSPTEFVWLRYLPFFLSGLIYCAVGLVIFFNKSDSWFRLYVALVFIIMGTSTGVAPGVLGQVHPVLGGLYNFLGAVGWQLMFILFYLFPDGHFVPRWTRWLLLGWVGINLLNWFVPSLAQSFSSLFYVPLVLSTIGSQVYRYFRHSDTVQRQQTKWLVYVLVLLAIYGPFGIQPFIQPASFSQNGATGFLWTMLLQFLGIAISSLILVSIGIAILRYRLWDIDIIIRRTLIYVPLTAILAGVFAVTITLSQKLFVAFTGTQSESATALATLLVVAVFDPIKRSIQSIVDRRFKEVPDPVKELKAYGDQVKAVLNVVRVEQSTSNLLDRALAAYHAKNGAVYLERNGEMKLAQTRGEWSDDPKLTVSLGDAEQDGSIGKLSLGPRLNGADYSDQDRQTLQTVSNLVALAIRTAERTK